MRRDGHYKWMPKCSLCQSEALEDGRHLGESIEGGEMEASTYPAMPTDCGYCSAACNPSQYTDVT